MWNSCKEKLIHLGEQGSEPESIKTLLSVGAIFVPQRTQKYSKRLFILFDRMQCLTLKAPSITCDSTQHSMSISEAPRATVRNQLLSNLPLDEYQRILPHLETIHLSLWQLHQDSKRV